MVVMMRVIVLVMRMVILVMEMIVITIMMSILTTVTTLLHIHRMLRTRFRCQPTRPLIALLRTFLRTLLSLLQLLQVKLLVGNLDVADIDSLFLKS